MKTSFLSLLLVSIALMTAQAQTKKALSTNDEKALQQTVELLNDKKIREDAISKDAKAKQADAYTKHVAGEKTEDVYALASKIFDRLARQYNGDAEKMKAAMEAAQRNPAAFANQFTPEELKALKAIAGQLPQATDAPK